MRLFEILMITMEALSILNLILIRNSALRLGIPVLSSAMAVISLAFEGYRLPMLPAYILCLILLIHGISKKLFPNIKSNKILNGVGLTFLVLIFALTIASALFLPVINLPEPSGTYNVGTVVLDLTDYSRKGIFAPTDEYRKIPVQIWYPASDIKGKKRATWLNSKKMSEAFAECKKVPNLFEQLNLIKTNSYLNAEVSNKEKNYPVILFSGGAAMFNGQNVIQMEELASNGYIVCSVGHPYDDFACIYSDGAIIKYNNEHFSALTNDIKEALEAAKRQYGDDPNNQNYIKYVLRNTKVNNENVKIWREDMSFAANKLAELNTGSTDSRFKGKLDLVNIGIFGHSFGGAAAGETCLNDNRFKAFINMDGTPFGTAVDNVIQQPFMILTTGRDNKHIISNAYSEKQKNFTTVFINGSEHMNFSDFNTILPVIGKTVGMLGDIKAERQEQIMNEFILSFFNKYLKNSDEPLLDSLSSKYHEVTVEKR